MKITFTQIDMPSSKLRLVLYLEPELLEKIKKWAKEERRPAANWVVYLVEKVIEEKEQQQQP